MARVILEHVGSAGALIIKQATRDQEILKPLGPVGSSYDDKVAAAITAFKTLEKDHGGCAVIWETDGRSVLDALNGNVAKAASHTQRLQEATQARLQEDFRIEAVWVPSHCRIPENEKVDKLANAAVSRGFIEHNRAFVLLEVARTLSKQKQQSMLVSLEGRLDDALHLATRKAEALLNQLLAHCSPLVRSFRISGGYDPLYKYFSIGVPETFEHLMECCPGRRKARRKYFGGTRLSIADLCNPHPKKALGFLLDVGLV